MNFQKLNHLMKGKLLLITLLSLFFTNFISAQATWSLQKCVEYAKENSLTIKAAQYATEDAQLLEKQARLQRMPGVSGRGSFGQQFGRTVDPTTNEFDNQRIGFNSWGIDASVNLFDGGRIHNQIKQAELDVKAARISEQVQFNNMALLIANAYLGILNAQEQLENAKTRLVLTNEQLDRTDKLIDAGTLPANDRLDVLAQIARNEQTIVQASNTLEINYLNLYQLLEIKPGAEFEIEKPEITIPTGAEVETLQPISIYQTALTNQPQIKLDELRLKSAEYNTNLAKANMYPSLSLFGGLSSNWSSVARRFIPNGAFITGSTNPAVIDGATGTIAFFQPDGVVEDVSYFDQLDQNFGQNFGISLNVPIYSRGLNKIAVERAQLGILNAGLTARQNKQDLQTNVLTAITNVKAAKQNLAAAQKTVEANQRAYDNAQKRFDLGTINTFELTTAKNNLDTSEIDVVVAKYDYLFRLKIVDFYMGKELKM